MKRAIGVLILLLSLIGVPVAYGQTTSPPLTNTPTPTPTPTAMPSATDTLDAAGAADLAKRTVRMAETIKTRGSGVTMSLTSHGVVSFKPIAERMHMTEHDTIRKGGTTTSATQRSEMVIVNKGDALCTGHGKWACQSGSTSVGSGGMTAVTLPTGPGGFTVEFANPARAGHYDSTIVLVPHAPCASERHFVYS